MANKLKFILAGIFGAAFFVLIALVLTVDVAAIGAGGTNVGLSHINQAVSNLFGFNNTYYRITVILGIVAIATAVIFLVIGIVQSIKRKSILKADGEILALGLLYIVLIAVYLIFKFVVVNYRPIIMPKATAPESSFPSTHTLIACVIMGSTIMVAGKYVKAKALRIAVYVLCAVVLGGTVIGRLVAGVHWLTDIVGGMLLSAALLFVFSAVKSIITARQKPETVADNTAQEDTASKE